MGQDVPALPPVLHEGKEPELRLVAAVARRLAALEVVRDSALHGLPQHRQAESPVFQRVREAPRDELRHRHLRGLQLEGAGVKPAHLSSVVYA